MATPGLNLLQAAQKKLISLDLKRERDSASLAQQHPQQTPVEECQQGPRWKCLPLCGEHSQLTGRLSKCLGTSAFETFTEVLFFLCDGNPRGSLAVCQSGSGATIMTK